MDEEEFDRLLEDELDLLRELEEADAAIAEATALSQQKQQQQQPSQRKRPFEPDSSSQQSTGFNSLPNEHLPPEKRPRAIESLVATATRSPSPTPLPPPVPSQSKPTPTWHYYCTVPTVGSDFCSITGSQGQRIYLTICDAADYDKSCRSADSELTLVSGRNSSGFFASLLGNRGGQLRDQAVAENRKRQRRLDAWRAALAAAPVAGAAAQPAELWVSKYSPKSYLDLLSDESTNRALLHWLKLWDHAVFGRPRRQTVIPATLPNDNDDDNASGGDGRQPKQKQQRQFKEAQQENQAPEYDENGRPFFKVVLLWGPPGRGKTTLAHTAARQCGYNVVEMNASDDRSVEQFRARLDAVARSRGSVRPGGAGDGGGGSPTLMPGCLVLDEIDGAPGPAVDALVACLKAAPAGSGRKRGAGANQALLRPVICICNDPFVPALRQLRALALQLRMPDPPQTGLVSRLLEVCRSEGLPADRLAMASLASRHGGDLRSCLQALQFMGETGTDAGQSVVGRRDTVESLMSTMARLFSRQPMEASALAACAESDERLTECMHYNYPHVARDAKRAAAVADLLRHHDLLAASAFSSRQNDAFTLARYAPFALLACRSQLASRRAPRLSLPPTEQRGLALQQLLAQRAGVARGLLSDLAPGSRIGRDCLVLDLAPCLLDILQPSLRPVSTHLYTAKERKDLAALVDCMICYGLHYTQQRTPDGQMQFALEPPIDQLVRFTDQSISGARTAPLSAAVKQLVARELQSERLRRAESASLARLGQATPTATPERPRQQQSRALADTVRGLAPSAAAAASAAAEASAPAPVQRDFFGRPIAARPALAPAPVAAEQQQQQQKPRQLLNDRIWYKFNEGFSNAVRRPVKVRSFHSLRESCDKKINVDY